MGGLGKKTAKWGVFPVLALIFLILLIMSIYSAAMFRLFPDWETRSLFANSWTGLATLFSGLGLLGVGLALLLQSRQLEEQSQAVESSLEEQAAMREMLIRQTRALALAALAQVTSIQLDVKHRGYGSGSLKNQMDTLEELAELVQKELDPKL